MKRLGRSLRARVALLLIALFVLGSLGPGCDGDDGGGGGGGATDNMMGDPEGGQF